MPQYRRLVHSKRCLGHVRQGFVFSLIEQQGQSEVCYTATSDRVHICRQCQKGGHLLQIVWEFPDNGSVQQVCYIKRFVEPNEA